MCVANAGHLNLMLALGYELQRRGNTVMVFQVPDVEQKVLSAGLKCRVIGRSAYPIGSMPKQYVEQRKLSGLAGIKFAIKAVNKLAFMNFKEAPDAISAEGKNRISLARDLVNISSEAAEIEHLVGRIPEIMCVNDQLRPLWERWEKKSKDAKSPHKIFSHQEIRILKAFIEYLSYASDRFISQIHGDK